ncbi:MAG: hypothetical protein ACRELY_29700 [Polyangiaceae bacterium]
MKRFLISYSREKVTEQEWHARVAEFIRDIENDAELKGKILYTVMKAKDGTSYYHLAEVLDEKAGQLLQTREFFKAYTAATKQAGDDKVVVTPIETIAATTRPH